MRRTLRILGLAAGLAVVVAWLATGANRGWTRTSRPVKIFDPVTGLEGVASYRPDFVPGVDFLAAGLLGAALLGGASLLFRNQQTDKLKS